MEIKNTPCVSLIIPVYNVEKYLEKGLKSIEKQTLENFEVIIVNDGSTDKSGKIIEKFSKKNSKIKVINQTNQGPSAAKNVGIENSSGEYITFMDSDDHLEPMFLETLYTTAKTTFSDIVCCNFNFYYPKQKLKVYMPFTSIPGTYSKQAALRKLLLDLGTHHYPWNKIYKRSLFTENNIKYYKMYFEDIATCPEMFYYSKKITIITQALYNYSIRKNSILTSMTFEKVNDFISSLGVIRNFLEKKNSFNEYKNYIWAYAQKAKLVSYYYITNLHIKNNNYKGMKKNLSAANRSINYFSGDNFKISDDDIPKMPYPVKEYSTSKNI